MAHHKMADEILGQFKANIPTEHIQEIYSNWAQKYEEDMTQDEKYYPGPANVAEETAALLGERKESRILDLAAGTGLVARQLKCKYGFHDIDALDANKKMLDVAKEKGLYKNVILAMLGQDRLPIESNTYDAVAMAGGFVPGHVDGSCLLEIIRIVKPGGYFVAVVKESHLTSEDKGLSVLEGVMEQHHKDGLWQLVARKVLPYWKCCNGVYFIYEIC